MRHTLAQVLMWVLGRLLSAQGDHAPADRSAPLNPWGEPWTTPVPVHVVERRTPLRGEDNRLVRPYAPVEDTLQLRIRNRGPRRKTLLHAPHGLALPGACP